VVFKLKQPPQGPRRRMTARAVANELGRSTDTVMAAWPISMSTWAEAQPPDSETEELAMGCSRVSWAGP
jgi:hypothetical protein